MTEEQLKAVETLVSAGYLMSVKGKLKATAKLNDDYRPAVSVILPEKASVAIAKRTTVVDWDQLYIRFIQEAGVPKRAESTDGGLYDLNKFSKDACKEFRNMIEKRGIRLDILTGCTKLYYKSAVRLKKSITNYIVQGDWRSDYEALLQSAEKGNLEQHVKTELDGVKKFTRYKVG